MLTSEAVAQAQAQKQIDERLARRAGVVEGRPGEVLVPIVAAVAVGEKRLIKITEYRPAAYGPAPEAGMYLGPEGYVTDPEAATDFRAQGPTDEQVAAAVAAYLQANPPGTVEAAAPMSAQMGRRLMSVSEPEEKAVVVEVKVQPEEPQPKRSRKSSSKMSTLAARVLRDPKATEREKKLAASVLSQDEEKGQN